jgi:hypothetical protein
VPHHVVEHSLVLDQLVRGSLLDNYSFLHHEYAVVVGYRVQSVSNRYHRRLLELLPDQLLDEHIGLRVKVGSSLVKNQKFIFGEQ